MYMLVYFYRGYSGFYVDGIYPAELAGKRGYALRLPFNDYAYRAYAANLVGNTHSARNNVGKFAEHLSTDCTLPATARSVTIIATTPIFFI